MGILDTAGRIAGGAIRTGMRAVRLGGADKPAHAAKPLGDADLTNKVRTEVLRGLRGEAKGAIDINVVDGAVWLRGTARTPEAINRLEAKARAIPEVSEVHNLLHLPGTPAPSRTDTPAAHRKTRRGAAPKRPRTEPRTVNADKTIADGEALPKDLAAERAGRRAAKLGTEEATTRRG